MLRTCVQRFDVTRNLKNFCKTLRTKHALNLRRGFHFQPPTLASKMALALRQTKHMPLLQEPLTPCGAAVCAESAGWCGRGSRANSHAVAMGVA
jgi:hypothetical protein